MIPPGIRLCRSLSNYEAAARPFPLIQAIDAGGTVSRVMGIGAVVAVVAAVATNVLALEDPPQLIAMQPERARARGDVAVVQRQRLLAAPAPPVSADR